MSNRSVSTDALETLGSIIDDTQKRDAIHLAVLPMVAVVTLKPSESIGLVPGGAAPYAKDPLGIVDPFLTAPVQAGERFWMVLRPRLVTSLRHVWTHPAFPDDEVAPLGLGLSKETSEAWLRNFCAQSDCPDYETVLAIVMGEDVADKDGWGGGRITDGSLHFSGSDAHGEIPPEFWDHMEVVTGRKMTMRPDFFSCSC